jgi:hypothetical protein
LGVLKKKLPYQYLSFLTYTLESVLLILFVCISG